MHLIHQPHHSAVSSDNSDEAQNVLFDRMEYILHNIVTEPDKKKGFVGYVVLPLDTEHIYAT